MWNIQGLFQSINGTKYCKLLENDLKSSLKEFDLLCLQETHCGPNDLQNLFLDGYICKHFNRPKSLNGRYFGGMLLIVRENLFRGLKIFCNYHHDKLWVKFEKEFFGLPQNIFLCFLYASPASSPYTTTLDYDIFQELEKDCNYFHAEGEIMIAGDLNARTNLDPDYVLDEGDTFSPISQIDHYIVDEPLSRTNMDSSPVDTHGEKLLDLCKSQSLRILNGRFLDKGSYTRFPTRIGDSPSLIDYFLIESSLLGKVRSFNVKPLTHLSDHCCLHTSMNTDFCMDIEDQHIPEQINLYPDRYKPDAAALTMFQRVLKANLSQNSSWSNPPLSTNDIATNLTNIILRSADVTVKRTKVKPKPRGGAPLGQPWYDNQCRAQKSKLNTAKKILHAKPFDQLSISNYLSSRRAYKKCLKRAEQRHRAKFTEKLDSILTDNPRQYWQLIDKMRKWGKDIKTTKDEISSSKWVSYFENLFYSNGETSNHSSIYPVFNELGFAIKREEISTAI